MMSTRLCIATATSPVSLQKHEILRGHLVAVRVQSTEGILAERKCAMFSVMITCVIARNSPCQVCKQCHVAVRGCVGVPERDWLAIDLAKIHTELPIRSLKIQQLLLDKSDIRMGVNMAEPRRGLGVCTSPHFGKIWVL